MSDEESILAREAQLIFSNVQGFNMSESLRVWRGKIKAGPPNNLNYEFEFIFPHGFPNKKPILKTLTPIFHPNMSNDGYVNLDILDRWRPEFHGYQVLLQLISLLKRSPPKKEPGYITASRQKGRNEASITSNVSEPKQNYQSTSSNRTPSPSIKFDNFRKVTRAEIGITSRGGSTLQSPENQREAQDVAILKKQLSSMRGQVTKQEEELTRIRARNAIGIGADSPSSKQSKQLQDTFKHLNPNDQTAELESEQIAISELMAGLQEKHQSGEISIFDYSKLYKKYSRDLFILKKKLEYIREKQ